MHSLRYMKDFKPCRFKWFYKLQFLYSNDEICLFAISIVELIICNFYTQSFAIHWWINMSNNFRFSIENRDWVTWPSLRQNQWKFHVWKEWQYRKFRWGTLTLYFCAMIRRNRPRRNLPKCQFSSPKYTSARMRFECFYTSFLLQNSSLLRHLIVKYNLFNFIKISINKFQFLFFEIIFY